MKTQLRAMDGFNRTLARWPRTSQPRSAWAMTTRIALDADRVALAAIQGPNEKVEVRSGKAEKEIEQLRSENNELKTQNQVLGQRLERLEKGLLGQP